MRQGTNRIRRAIGAAVITFTIGGLGTNAAAFDGVVEKMVFELPSYTTVGGETIANVRIGWESYGTLNEARDNAILITHFFSGTSHAAGRYRDDDPKPGYWDRIIGSGQAIDTDRYYVLSTDTLVNLNANDPTVVTTGPATINPGTGRPYGLDFPVVLIRDFVNVQKALIDTLGIRRLHAVIGASMGALQAIDWAAAYPDRVARVVPVIGGAVVDAFLIGWLDRWAAPIRIDPNWNGGDYYGGPRPLAGLTEALKMVTLHARHWRWATRTFGRQWAVSGADPRDALDNRYAIEAWLDQAARARAELADANHFLYLVKANQTFIVGNHGDLDAGLATIDAPVLLLPALDDLVFYPEAHAEPLRERLSRLGVSVEFTAIAGDLGHVNGIAHIDRVEDRLAAFLARPGL